MSEILKLVTSRWNLLERKEPKGWQRLAAETIDGKIRLRRLNDGESSKTYADVNPSPQNCRLQFTGVRAAEGFAGDLTFGLTWTLTDPVKFWEFFPAGPAAPVVAGMVADDLHHRLRPYVETTAVSLDPVNRVNVEFWTQTLQDVLEQCGLAARVGSAKWQSADADRAREEQEHRKAAEARALLEARAAQARELEAERRRQAQARQAALAHDSALTERQRRAELRRLEREERRAEAEFDVQMAEIEARRVAVLNQYDPREEAVAQREAILEGMRTEAEHTRALFHDVKDHIDTALEELLERLQAAQPEVVTKAVYEAMLRFGISPDRLSRWGVQLGPASFVAWCQRAASEQPGVLLSLERAATRSVGHGRTASAVSIGENLSFEVNSETEGYLTLINAGTAGDFILLVPNAKVDGARSRIRAGSHRLPSEELLPKGAGGNLEEWGPVGIEHIVAIVSDEPLVTPDLLKRLQPLRDDRGQAGQYFDLAMRDLEALNTRILELGPERVRLGLVSFLVEKS